MKEALELLAFAGIMAVAQFSPGPDMILLTRTSLREGGRAGASMACGIATGLAVHSFLALSGAAYIFTNESIFSPYLKILASGYLLYLAKLVFFSAPCSAEPTHAPQRSHFLQGLLCNLLNPKAALILSSMCAPFVDGHQEIERPLTLGLMIVVQGALLWVIWAYGLQIPRLRRAYDRGQVLINRVFAILLALLAVTIWIR
ncbi:MAG: LysE family translocator [Akkermansiaceae bacterium]